MTDPGFEHIVPSDPRAEAIVREAMHLFGETPQAIEYVAERMTEAYAAGEQWAADFAGELLADFASREQEKIWLQRLWDES